MSEFSKFLNEQLRDEEFRGQWEKIQPEMDAMRAAFVASISQNANPKDS